MTAELKFKPRRVMLVEDHYFTALGVLRALASNPGITVAANFSSAEEALNFLDRDPNIETAIVDLGLPGMDGMELTKHLLKRHPGLAIIWLTAYPVVELKETSRALGAKAVLYKNCSPEELCAAVLEQFSEDSSNPASPARFCPHCNGEEKLDLLSPRQREILSLVAQGLMTKEIAHILSLSPRTVESHRDEIMHRLDFHSIAQLTRFACRHGLVPL